MTVVDHIIHALFLQSGLSQLPGSATLSLLKLSFESDVKGEYSGDGSQLTAASKAAGRVLEAYMVQVRVCSFL